MVALIGQLKRYMKDGPKATKVQNIIRRMEEKRLEEFEGEDEFLNKLWEIRMAPNNQRNLVYINRSRCASVYERGICHFMTKK